MDLEIMPTARILCLEQVYGVGFLPQPGTTSEKIFTAVLIKCLVENSLDLLNLHSTSEPWCSVQRPHQRNLEANFPRPISRSFSR